MRTSAKYLIGSLAFGLFASEALATSGPGWVRQAWQAPLAAIQLPSGGAFQGGSHPDRVEAEKWLRNARSAMNEGKFDVADYSIRKAEEHASRIPATEVPLAYTPQMAREELIARATPMPAPAAPVMNNDPNVVARPYQPANDPTRNMPASTVSPFNGSLGQEPATLPMPVGPGAVDAQQDLLRQKLTQEVFRERAVAERMVAQKDPRGGLEHLRQLRMRLDQAEIDPQARRQLILVVDREISDLEAFIQRNLADIENVELNAQRMADVQQMQTRKIEVEQRLAQLVEEFNKLMDEYRWAEAEVIARQAMELAPTEPVVQNMIWKSKYARNLHQQMAIRDQKQDGVVAALTNTEEASIPFDDNDPYRFPEIDDWRQISRRAGMGRDRQRTAEEIRITNTLKTQKIDLRFDNTPLAEALDILGAQAGINFHLDRAAMMTEAVTSDTPVSINLPQPIVLESGLTLLLDNLNLTYEVRDDVVRITTPEAKSRLAEPRTYYVGDLVMPIPNFIPTYNMGLGGALANAYQNLGMGMGGMPGLGSPMSPFSFAANQGGSIASQALAQNLPAGAMAPPSNSTNPTLFGGGPGGMGGGIIADFDPLMELIQRTISPESWEDLGGTGRMQEFRANLSLVIYQSQDVHEQIQDLLDQLRLLQDLQITIEVRFITLQDDFFERIGVDFDFDVRDNNRFARDGDGNPILPQDGQPGGIIGLGPDGNPTPDFDLAFDQGNFGSAVPTFGGFDPNTAANFGFAILSDIEVFMLLQAAKGDTRTNILQAPKVTLFNGQTALVNDTSQRPFVTGIVPVVGDFAAAQMPVVVVLSEGTQLSVNAVATDDRRFVRLTLVPFFSQIGDVEEFTFEGTETTTTGTTVPDPTDPTRPIRNGASTTRTGSTVQLPTFASTSINTTVSVPDGGTVLLGGIKRLREGRNERGVPMLSNLPFVNRLFKNVGIGREAQSLMMMVTPRIIIQEEEEANQVGAPAP